MRKSISLGIPNPCSENWANFEKREGGRLCHSCNKVVVDFTKMSDRQLLDYLSAEKGHICGRVRPSQLREYPLPNNAIHIFPGAALLKAGLVSLFLAMMAKPAAAQQHDAVATKTEVVETRIVASADTVRSGIVVKGRVLADEDNSPLPGVNVWLKGSERGTVSDADGRFEFTGLKEGDVLQISFIGFTTLEYVVRPAKEQDSELALQPDIALFMDAPLLGALAVEGTYESSQPNLWNRFKMIFKRAD